MPRLDDTFVQYDFDKMEHYWRDGAGAPFCLTYWDRVIIVSALRFAGWKSRWFDENGRLLRDVGRLDDLETALTRYEDLIARLNDMSTCDDLSESIANLAAILSGGVSGGCGCGSSGAPSVSPGIEDLDTGDITADEGTPPDGYEDWTLYQARKCDIATWMLNNLLTDVQWMQTQTIAAMTVGGLAAGLVGFLSGGVLLLILGVLIAMLAYNIEVLADLEAAIQDSYDDLLCALYTGENAQDSYDQFGTALQTAINAQTVDTVARSLLHQLAMYWLDTTSLNLLYSPEEQVSAINIPLGGNCVECGVNCDTDQVIFGELFGAGQYNSTIDGTTHKVQIRFRADGISLDCSDDCGDMRTIKLSASGWTVQGGGTPDWRLWQDSDCPMTGSNPSVYESNTPPSSSTEYTVRLLAVESSTEFQLTITEV